MSAGAAPIVHVHRSYYNCRMAKSSVDLTHHFLIAMPNMADPHFAKSLTYVCEHKIGRAHV